LFVTTRSIHDVEMLDITHQGYAMGREVGRPVFAAYALPGEIADVELHTVKRDYAIGHATRIERAAPERVVAPCPHFHTDGCGGCQWQHADYAAQLRFKSHIVSEQLRHIGHIAEPPVHPTLASPSPLAYRTHATFTVGANGRLCFVSPDGADLQPIDRCLILRPELQAMVGRLADLDFSGAERVRLQMGSASDDLCVVTYGEPAVLDPIIGALHGASFVLIKDGRTRVLRGLGELNYQIAGRTFRATAGGFFQVNLKQAEKLVELVLALLSDRVDHALDLYAGVGLFTRLLAEYARHVTSIEEYAPAVIDARRNLAAFPGTDLRTGAVERVLPPIREAVDFVVTDPPRAGMRRPALDALVTLQPLRIIYVSCEPSTLARDARVLLDSGYQLSSVQPLDMFPQTYHIESVARFDLG
jgi:23S rRNA (uracil1939-C5)-methyltransferase